MVMGEALPGKFAASCVLVSCTVFQHAYVQQDNTRQCCMTTKRKFSGSVITNFVTAAAFVRSGLVRTGNSVAIKGLPNYLENFIKPVGGYLFPCFPGYQFYSIKFINKLVCSITRTGLLADGAAPWFKVWR